MFKKVLITFTVCVLGLMVMNTWVQGLPDTINGFADQDDFTFKASIRTHIPTAENEADKGKGYFTFSRASVATFEDADGIVHTAATNIPRFGGTRYNPANGEHSQTDSNGNLIPTSRGY